MWVLGSTSFPIQRCELKVSFFFVEGFSSVRVLVFVVSLSLSLSRFISQGECDGGNSSLAVSVWSLSKSSCVAGDFLELFVGKK